MWLEIMIFELKYRAKRLDTYLYFTILFLFSIVGVDFVYQGVDLGEVKTNAPYVIAHTMAVLSCFFMIITSMIPGVAILRDHEHEMESLMFINPLKKRDYLLGRFLGSFIIVCFVFSGIILGMILGESMSWRNSDALLPFRMMPYIQGFLFVVFPSIFYGSAIFFTTGALTKNLIVVYTQAIFFFIVLMLSRTIENSFISGILDPFAFAPIQHTVNLWSVPQRNADLLSVDGLLLYNRLFWIIIGLVALGIVYFRFQFIVVKDKSSKKKSPQNPAAAFAPFSEIKMPDLNIKFNWKTSLVQLSHHSVFYCKTMLKEASFWAIVISAMIILLINSINLENSYGISSFPRTYLIIEELQEMSIYFFLIILIFYSGELIWKERTIKLDLIYDALPISDFVSLAGKFIGLMMIFTILTLSLIISGLIFQSVKGFYQFEIELYISGFFLELFPFLVLFSVVSFLIQVLLNSKYISHLMVLLFFILVLIFDKMGFSHNLYQFGGDNLSSYSDMNGYGHFLIPYIYFKSYWILFVFMLFLVAVVFSIRGKETHLKTRWRLAKQRFNASILKMGLVSLILFISLGSFIFYNTNVLNDYWTASKKDNYRADYEKTLKKLTYLPQPKIIAVNLQVELYPSDRDYTVEGYYLLTNKTNQPLQEIHIQKRIDPQAKFEYLKIEGGAKLNEKYKDYHYFIYELDQALEPGDTIEMAFKQSYITEGFVESNPGSKIIHNGTFFNQDYFPTLGYNSSYELESDQTRKQYKLEAKSGRVDRNDPLELQNAKSGDDGYEIDFEIIIGTELSQTAIAPGVLKRKWTEANRNYFHYKMDQAIINFYSIVSADYELFQDQWMQKNDSLERSVQLEIYHHEGHDYNLHRMMESMQHSLDYFSEQFSPYPYRQMRIMEVPRYVKYAQSFPNSIPYSESLGFMMDVNDETDIDMPFFITAHEVAHQWWGLQLIAANVKGRKMLLESLAQYSAIMVMKRRFSEDKMNQLIENEMDRYFLGRANDFNPEVPLSEVDKQDYIAYRKGGINLYALQHYISEDSMNLALKRFIRDWNGFGGLLQKERYATSADLLEYFKVVTPDSLQYVIEDLFETVTYYDNKMISGHFEELADDLYRVDLELEANKYRRDSLGNEKMIGVDDWVDIGIYGEGEDGNEKLIYLKKYRINEGHTRLSIEVNWEPLKMGIDPKHVLIDGDLGDNFIEMVRRN